VRHGLEDEYRVNIEVNHATLAGHSFQHEVATAFALGIFGSIDINRGDYQNGWDTDQFPNSVDELALALYEILRGGGFTTGGFNFDTKLRRQSLAATTCSMPTSAASTPSPGRLLVAAGWSSAGDAGRLPRERYAGWDERLGRAILDGRGLAERSRERAVDEGHRPAPGPAARRCSRTWSTSRSGRPTVGRHG
jgi:xylose isomerase